MSARGGGGSGSPVGDLWDMAADARRGEGPRSHNGSHESELDLAMLVSDCLKGNGGEDPGSPTSATSQTRSRYAPPSALFWSALFI